MAMKWYPVESSLLKEIGFDAAANVIGAKFPNGSIYNYEAKFSLAAKFEAVRNDGESVGKAFNRLIKADPAISYKKVS